MHPLRLIFLAAALACLGLAPAPFPRPEKKAGPHDIEWLQGPWRLVKYEHNGRDLTQRATTPIWTVERNQLHVGSAAANAARTTYGLDLDARQAPAAFAILTGGRPSYVGSYQVVDGRWVIVMAHTGGAAGRPTRFDSAGDNYLMTFERVGK